MYTEQQLQGAAQIIKQIAKEHNVTVEDVRRDMQEAMNYGRRSSDPQVQARWKTFQFQGNEPTVEEFILWTASLALH